MLGYFGPEGTFTHQALACVSREEGIPFDTVSAALDAVREGQVDAAMVPIENSVEGGVTVTLDRLADGQLMIVREVLLPVQFDLCARPGATLDGIRRVVSHPHAIAQVREWLAANVPQARITEGGSTAGAAKEVSDPQSKYDAAICASIAGQMYGLVPLATGIADNSDAVTRFVLVSKPGPLPPPSGADKTTLVAYIHADRPGALLELLSQFANRGVNLCRLESRPTKTKLGNYCFSIDAEGHVRDPRLAEAMLGLHRVCESVVFLGSYPRADGVRPKVAYGFSDEEFANAQSWYATLLNPKLTGDGSETHRGRFL